jgi:hypothetical protein
MILRTPILALALWMSLIAPSHALELRQEVQEFRAGLESRARATLQSILGAEARIVVSVEVKASQRSMGRPSRRVASDVPVDLGFVPQVAAPESPPSQVQPASMFSEIQSVQVRALISPDVDPALVSVAAKALEMQFAPDNAKVELTTMEGLAVRKPASAEEEKKQQEKAAAERKFEELPWLPWAMIGAVASIVLLGAAWLLSRGMAQTGAALGEGLKSLAPRSGAGSVAVGGAASVEKKSEEPESETATRVRFSAALSAQPANIALVARMVRENPVRFVSCWGGSPEDFRGLRSLLVQLDEGTRSAFQSIVSEEALARIHASAEGGEPFAFAPWLQEFCERLATSHLLGTKLVEAQVEGSRLVALLRADSSHLLQAAESVGSPAAWRIVSELLQPPALKSVFARGSGPVLEGVLRSAEVSGSEVREASERLIAALEHIPERQQDEAAKRRFLAGSLLPGVLQALESMQPGEDEPLLEGLARQSPSLHEMVGERYWGISMIERVPESILLQSLEGFEVEDRALLLFAVPEARRQRLIALLPEGMAKVILQDLVDRKTTRQDPMERRQAAMLLREWIAGLKRQSDAGLFAPAPLGGSDSVATPRAA